MIKFSGRDDAYNVIEGLRHGGWAQIKRKALTDFGSGYRGLVGMKAGVVSALGLDGAARMPTKATREFMDLAMESMSNREHTVKSIMATGMERGAAESEWATSMKHFQAFDTELEQVEKAGLTHFTAVNEELLKGNRKELKALLRHERVHAGGGGTTPGTAPVGWNKLLTGLNYNQGNTASYFEEFLAYSYQAKLTGRSSAMDMIVHPTDQKMSGLLGMVGGETAVATVEARTAAAAIQGEALAKQGQQTRLAGMRAARRLSGKDRYNTIEGMGHGGMAEIYRKALTPFGSPADVGKAMMQASELYKTGISKILQARGIKNFSFHGGVSTGGRDLTYFVKGEKGDNLVTINRMFSDESVELGMIQVNKSLEGQGIARSIYESEADIFRQIGYGPGTKIGSNVVSPVTGRMQAQMYGSKITSETPGREALLERIKLKQITDDEMPMVYFEGTIPLAGRNTPERSEWAKTLNTERKRLSQQRKVARATLQRNHSATVWEAGINGGRRSRS